MKHSRARLAWLILLVSFITFCVIIVAVPLGVRWFLRNAETDQKAVVESLAGTIVVEPPVGTGAIPVSKGQRIEISQGSTLRSDEGSEAVITFYDHSFMRVFPSTTVKLTEQSSPRFASSALPNKIRLELLGGQVRIGTALTLDRGLEFTIETLQADIALSADGSYAIMASNDRTEVTNYRGQALIGQGENAISLGARQRTELVLEGPQSDPVGIARNLVENGDFSQEIEGTWRTFNDQGADGGDVDGKITPVIDEGRRAVHFKRTNGQGNHCETILEQTIDQQLPDAATTLTVRASAKVRYQSLSGGGYLSSEYPLMIRITYRDAYDSETEWVQGFYVQNEDNTPTTFGTQIERNRWYSYESENLLDTLPVRPFKIVSIRVYASGHDYESLVSDVMLVVE